jgi:hypothetical protein
MTPQGHVYERVSGKSPRVTDPALLDRLLRRGRERRAAAETFARRAATLAIQTPEWQPTWSVRVALSMAPVGRETDDINSRLFVPSSEEALREALLSRFMPERPDRANVSVLIEQSSLGAVGVLKSAREFDWSEWAVSAHWTGAVAASATFSVNAIPAPTPVLDVFLTPAYRAVAPLVKRLGGYGPAHLALIACRAPEHGNGMIDGRFVAPEARPQPPTVPLFRKLPVKDGTVIGRWTGVESPSDDVLASMDRELDRAAGRRAFEPEATETG